MYLNYKGTTSPRRWWYYHKITDYRPWQGVFWLKPAIEKTPKGANSSGPYNWPIKHSDTEHYGQRMLDAMKPRALGAHSAHLGHFRRLPPASDIRLGRNGQFWDICDAAEGRHSAR